jgi:hypothetical protein
MFEPGIALTFCLFAGLPKIEHGGIDGLQSGALLLASLASLDGDRDFA